MPLGFGHARTGSQGKAEVQHSHPQQHHHQQQQQQRHGTNAAAVAQGVAIPGVAARSNRPRSGSQGTPPSSAGGGGPRKFHKMNTIANLYHKVFGFEIGSVLVEVQKMRALKPKYCSTKNVLLEVSLSKPGDGAAASSSLAAKHGSADRAGGPPSPEPARSAARPSQAPRKKVRLPALQQFSHAGGPALAPGELSWGSQEVQLEVDDESQELRFTLLVQARLGKATKGTGSLSLSDNGVASGEILTVWVPLSLKGKTAAGEVLVRVQYTSDKDRNQSYRRAMASQDEWLGALMEKNLVLVATLCRVYASDELAKVLTRLFNHRNQALRLLIQLVYRELKKSIREETLFRDDSMCTKTCRNYFMLVGSDYLKAVLLPHIQVVIDHPEDFEVDPARLSGASDAQLTSNRARLRRASQGIVDSLFGSIRVVPYNMRKFFDLALQLVRQVFPNADSSAMSNFFFLRWICPVIISPDGFKLVDFELEPAPRRSLVLVAKLIQNMANGVEFREPYLEPINDFVTGANSANLRAFMTELSGNPMDGPEDAYRPPMEDDEVALALSVVIMQFQKNLARVEADLLNDPRVKPGPTTDSALDNMRLVKGLLQEPA